MGIVNFILHGGRGGILDVVKRGRFWGAVAYTERLLKFNPEFHPFLDPIVGTAMNQNAAFGGTPERVHNGTDSSLYTASAISGSKFTFNSTAHAKEGICVIVAFGLIDSGETVTITVDGLQTVLTEGSQWTAGVDDPTTAESLKDALTAVSGVTATRSSLIITVIADVGSDITELVTSGESGELTASARSVLTDNGQNGDEMQFAKGSDLTLANFTAITMDIFVDNNWGPDDSIEVYGYDTGGNVEVGDRVPLEDFFDSGDFDTWHSIAIPLSTMGIESSTIVDAFRIQIVAKSGPSPTWYLDQFQVEQTGTPVVFKATTPLGTVFHIDELRIAIADNVGSTVSNGTMEGLSYDKILGVAVLPNGIIFRRVENGESLFAVTIKQLGDFLSTGSNLINHISDGSNTFITLLVQFPEPIILKGSPEDNFLSFTVSDDLSGLLQFTAAARGALVIDDKGLVDED